MDVAAAVRRSLRDAAPASAIPDTTMSQKTQRKKGETAPPVQHSIPMVRATALEAPPINEEAMPTEGAPVNDQDAAPAAPAGEEQAVPPVHEEDVPVHEENVTKEAHVLPTAEEPPGPPPAGETATTASTISVIEEDIPDDAPKTESDRADYGQVAAEAGEKPATTAEAAEQAPPPGQALSLAELEVLEAKLKKGQRESTEHLRIIFQREGWKTVGLKNFEEYCLIRLGHTRKWGYAQLRWLERTERLEVVTPTLQPPLTVAESDALAELYDKPGEDFVAALLEAQEIARRSRKPRTTKMVKEAASRRLSYIQGRGFDYYRGTGLSYDEWRTLGRLDKVQKTSLERLKQAHGDKPVLELCKLAKAIPVSFDLLKVARGDELTKLVDDLLKLADIWAKENTIAKLQQEVNATAVARPAPAAVVAPAAPAAVVAPTATAAVVANGEDGEEDEKNVKYEIVGTGDLTEASVYNAEEQDIVDTLDRVSEAISNGDLVIESDSALFLRPANQERSHLWRWQCGEVVSMDDLLRVAATVLEDAAEALVVDKPNAKATTDVIFGLLKTILAKL